MILLVGFLCAKSFSYSSSSNENLVSQITEEKVIVETIEFLKL